MPKMGVTCSQGGVCFKGLHTLARSLRQIGVKREPHAARAREGGQEHLCWGMADYGPKGVECP